MSFWIASVALAVTTLAVALPREEQKDDLRLRVGLALLWSAVLFYLVVIVYRMALDLDIVEPFG